MKKHDENTSKRNRIQARLLADEMEISRGGCMQSSLEPSLGGAWDITGGASDCDDPDNQVP